MHPEHPEGFDDALGASYRLISKLGEGATGEVWSTEHRRTGETVATKLLRPEHLADRVLIRRFFEERDVLTGLRHHGVVAVRDLVAEGDRLAIVMEYVDGGSLRDVLRSRGPLPPALAVAVTAAALDGLAAAHTQGVVHRDIKPDNVLLSREWWSLRPGDVKLVDFGISRILTEGSRGTTGSMLGTPEYMAPELMTRGVAERPADVYGVGVMLYELLAGRTPFSGPGNDYSVAHRHVTSRPPALPLPAPLAEVLDSLLAKDPDARPGAATTAEVLRGLRDELSGLPALPRQQPPTEFEEARGPVTLLRGFSDATVPRAAPVLPDLGTPEGAASQGTDFDLGVPSQVTTLRPFLAPPRPVTPADVAPPPEPHRPGWKDPRLITLVAACLVLIVGAALFVTLRPEGRGGQANAADEKPRESAGPVSAQNPPEQPLPTGLGVTRAATYDPGEQTIELTVTYTAADAPLTGPFLEVLPGASPDECPFDVEWGTDGTSSAEPNVSSTGVTNDCAWSVDVGTIAAGESATATATITQELEGDDPEAALSEWLGSVQDTTNAELAAPALTGTAYPVQRLSEIRVDVTNRTVVDTQPLNIRLYAVWVNGEEDPAPIYRSPLDGSQTPVMDQIAGPDAVRFTDSCGGNLLIGDQGTTVSPRSFTDSCKVGARVGNFANLESNEFAITTRGS